MPTGKETWRPGRLRTPFPTKSIKATPACKSVARWTSFPRNARRMKGKCRGIESRMDSLEKERERKEIQYDIFNGFLAGLSETGSCRWISMRDCSIGSWITQRSIPTAGWYSLSATEWRSARRFKSGSDQGIGFVPDAFGRFSVWGNRVYCVWKFVKN